MSLADGGERTRVFAEVVDRASLLEASVPLSAVGLDEGLLIDVFIHPDWPNRRVVADVGRD